MYLQENRKQTQALLLEKTIKLAQDLALSFYKAFESFISNRPLTKENCYSFLQVCSQHIRDLYSKGIVIKVKYTLDYETLFNFLAYNQNLTIAPLVRTGVLDIAVGLLNSEGKLELVIVDLKIDEFRL